MAKKETKKEAAKKKAAAKEAKKKAAAAKRAAKKTAEKYEDKPVKGKVAEFESRIEFRASTLVNRAVYDESKLQSQMRRAGIKKEKVTKIETTRSMDKQGGFLVTKFKVTYKD